MQHDDQAAPRTLAGILSHHLADRKQTDVADEAGIPKATLSRWLSGKSVSPYHRDGLLDLLAVLGLKRAQVNQALRLAGLPSVDELWEQQPERRRVLARWRVRAPNNLPAELTSFVGRDAEVINLAERLADPVVRLVTLTGPGGSGKTRLSLRVASELLDVFTDGVTFVPLADVFLPESVMPAIGAALGLVEASESLPATRVIAWLASRRTLLVLDNLEQVIDCGPELASLLRAAPGLTILATSRTPLAISGEHRWPVRPLAVPLPGLSVARLGENPAVRLFVQRARAVDPDFAFTAASAADVSTLCLRLDGLPLAIELVAARVDDMSLGDLVAQVPDALGLAADGPRDVALRHRALRETIAWSERLLPRPAQLLFARLGVLHGWDDPLAVAIGAGPGIDPAEVLVLLGVLMDASLVERIGGDAAPRYRMLATIREYALERLDALGERNTVAERHARAMLALAEDAPPYVPGALRGGWFPRVDRERLNFDAALEWANQSGETLLLAQLTAALWPYWIEYRQGVAGRRWLDASVATDVELPDETRAMLLTGVCFFELNQGDHAAATHHATKALALWRQLGDPRGQALVLQQLGWSQTANGDLSTTITTFEEMLAQWQAAGDVRGIALALSEIGTALFISGQFDAALPYLQREREVIEPTSDPLGIARARHDLGLHALLRLDAAAALTHLRDAVDRLNSEQPNVLVAASQLYLATSLCLTNQLDEAEAIYSDLLQLHERSGDRLQQSLVILGHAAVAHRRNNGHYAAWLCGVATTLQGPSGLATMASIQTLYEHETQLVVDQIGPDAFAAAFARGAAVPAGEALAAVRRSD